MSIYIYYQWLVILSLLWLASAAKCAVEFSSWPQWYLFALSHHSILLRNICLPLIPYPLNHLVIHGEEPHLNYWAWDVWYECWDRHKECHNPKGRRRGKSFDEDFVNICGNVWRHCSIYHEEKIPVSNGTPDENMFYQGEVTYSKRHLQVHNPDHTSVHRHGQHIPSSSSSLLIKGLWLNRFCAEEEYHCGTNKSIKHPAKY